MFKEAEEEKQKDAQQIKEIVEEMDGKINEDIMNEKKEREQHEDLLLSMLESTCEKIQTIIS